MSLEFYSVVGFTVKAPGVVKTVFVSEEGSLTDNVKHAKLISSEDDVSLDKAISFAKQVNKSFFVEQVAL